jgi:Winged helix DNA-binding domain
MTDVLSRRALNRATLARQHLLERAPVGALDLIEHLAGMQSQAPLAPYVGLWTRLRDFAPESLSTLTEQRKVVRIHLMRATVHLVSARHALEWRPLFDPPLDRVFRGDFDRAAVARRAATLLAERPRTRAELGRLLAAEWPGADPTSLAYAATNSLAVCQVPPRGVWGRTGPAAWAQVETWLGAPLRSVPPDGLVLRYLGAFGPASVADIQAWSGLTRLREVVEPLRPSLRVFADESGRELFDLPDAPRPDPDTPVPVRFLPEFDNLLLSHADRTRVMSEEHRKRLFFSKNGVFPGTFLVDGFLRGEWRITQQRTEATLTITPYAKLSTKDTRALTREGLRLLEFAAADAETRDVVVAA